MQTTRGVDRAWSREFRVVAMEGAVTTELVRVRGRRPLIGAVELVRQS